MLRKLMWIAVAFLATADAKADTAKTDWRAHDRALRAALARPDYDAALEALKALTNARQPLDAKLAPDPVLDRAFAEFYSRGVQSPAITAMIERIVADPQEPDRAHWEGLLGLALEAEGRLPEAAAAYRRAMALRAGPAADLRDARLGLARVTIPDDAAAALAVLPTAVDGWEAALLRGRALAMLDRRDEATAAYDAAWTASLRAPARDFAPARVAAERAVYAGRTGDRAGLIAALAVDLREREHPSGVGRLSILAPVCGRNGIRPEDQVVVLLSHRSWTRGPRSQVVWASRPGIAGAFLRAAVNLPEDDRDGIIAYPVALRCRRLPAVEAAAFYREEWTGPAGLYPVHPTSDPSPGDWGEELKVLSRTLPPDSPRLLHVITAVFRQSGELDSDVSPDFQIETGKRLRAVLASAGAPKSYMLNTDITLAALEFRTGRMTKAATLDWLSARLSEAAADPAIPLAAVAAAAISVTNENLFDDAFKAKALDVVLAAYRTRGSVRDERAAAVALRRIDFYGPGEAAARRLAREFALPPVLCGLMDARVEFIQASITSDDYPTDMLNPAMDGLAVVEYAVGPDRGTVDQRLIVSGPAYAFDAATLRGGETIRNSAPRFNGRPATCSVRMQTVNWKVPD